VTVSLLGLPLDANSSHLFGAAQAPQTIRTMLHSGSGNHVTERGLDAVGALDDLGDLDLENIAGSQADADMITTKIEQLVRAGQQVEIVGQMIT